MIPATEFGGRAGAVESLFEGIEERLGTVEPGAAAESKAKEEQAAVVPDFWLRRPRAGDIRALSRRLRGKYARRSGAIAVVGSPCSAPAAGG